MLGELFKSELVDGKAKIPVRKQNKTKRSRTGKRLLFKRTYNQVKKYAIIFSSITYLGRSLPQLMVFNFNIKYPPWLCQKPRSVAQKRKAFLARTLKGEREKGTNNHRTL